MRNILQRYGAEDTTFPKRNKAPLATDAKISRQQVVNTGGLLGVGGPRNFQSAESEKENGVGSHTLGKFVPFAQPQISLRAMQLNVIFILCTLTRVL